MADNSDIGIYAYASGSLQMRGSISNNTVANHPNNGIRLYGGSGATSQLILDNNLVAASGRNIYAYYASAHAASTVEFTNNTVQSATSGIEVTAASSTLAPEFMANVIDSHAGDGINCSFTSSSFSFVPYFEGNRIYANGGRGVYVKATAQVTAIANSWYDNGSYDFYNDGAAAVDATRNWWGVDTTNEMNTGTHPRNLSAIFDKYDDATKGSVDYANWLANFTAPNSPTLQPVTTPTVLTSQTLIGTKDAGSAIIVNGMEAVPADSQTDWSLALPLAEGGNPIALYARAPSGMTSPVITARIVSDRSAPRVFAATPGAGSSVMRAVVRGKGGKSALGFCLRLEGTKGRGEERVH